MPTLTTEFQRIGTSEYTVVGRNELRLYAKYNSQDIANNKTSVTMQLRTIAITGNYWSSGNYSTLSCGGDRGTLWYDIGTVNTSSEKEIGTWTFDLYHNDDGTYSGNGYATANVYGNIVPSVYGEFNLPTIARASQPSATSGNIEENIVIYTNRKSTSFTHTISYSFGSLSGTIATGVGDSTTWTLPSTFYSQIPNSKSSWGTITCTTYNGGTQIGSAKTCRFDVYTSEARCKPDITISATDMNATCTSLTGSNKKLIKFFSEPAVTLTATAKNSATISSTSIVCGDGKSSSNTSSFSYTFYEVESPTFTGNVTDSRGYSNSVTATGLTMVDYIKLTLNPVEIYRPSQTGTQIKIKSTGNYFNNTFGSASNTLTFKYRYREYGSSTWGNYTTINPTITNNTYSFDVSAGNSFDYRKQYEFEFFVNDELMSVIQEEISKPGIPIMWLGKNYSEFDGKKAFDWGNDDLTLDDDIYLGTTGYQIKDLLIETGSSGDDHYIKYPDGTLICYGSGYGVNGSYGTSNFAYEFDSFPYVTVTPINEGLVYQIVAKIYNVSTTKLKVVITWETINSQGSTPQIGGNEYNYIAIGKWK